jgi:hypothetical protein
MIVLLSLLAACHNEPTCDHLEPDDPELDCEPIDICCQGPECWYETQDGTRYDCAGNGNCEHAAIEVVCATCELTESTSTDVDCGVAAP